MRSRLLSLSLVLCALAASAPRSAHADRKIFGFTYPYMTLPEGARELEYYLDVGIVTDAEVTPSLPSGAGTLEPLNDVRPAFQHQLEFEYAITDRTDLGFYNVLQQDVGSPLEYEGVKFRLRHRFGDEGEMPLDPAIYGEVAYFGDEVELEQRLILGKRVRRIEIDFNLKIEEAFERTVVVEGSEAKVETEFELGLVPSLGFGYHVQDNFALGIELAPEISIGESTTFTSALGPTVSFTGNGFWWTIAAQVRVHGDEDETEGPETYKDSDVLVRSVLAIIL